MCTCTPEHVRMHACAHLHKRAYMQICISANMHASALTLAHSRLHAYEKSRVCTCTFVNESTHTYARSHARTCAHTHKHTYMITNIHKYKRVLVCICTLLHVHRQADGRTDGGMVFPQMYTYIGSSIYVNIQTRK